MGGKEPRPRLIYPIFAIRRYIKLTKKEGIALRSHELFIYLPYSHGKEEVGWVGQFNLKIGWYVKQQASRQDLKRISHY